MALKLIIFHCDDVFGHPIGGVRVAATGDPGPWESVTNACGDVIDPVTGAAGVSLTPAHYEVTFSKTGYITVTMPADIVESGIIVQALDANHSNGGGHPGTLPPVPTRAQVCSIQHSLAGLTYHTKQYGDVPAWFYGKLNAEDRAEARQCHRTAGDTHIPFPLTEAYRESGTLWPPALADGYDYTKDADLPTYRAIAHEAIADGFLIDCPMGGDGLGLGPGYNDEVGRTYGCGWLMQNMGRMLRALEGDGTPEMPDLTPYICFRPGWDAVFYGWGGEEKAGQQQYTTPLRWRRMQARPERLSVKALDEQQRRVKAFGEQFRQMLPNGFLSIEHTPGNIPCGEGGGDYAPGGLMTTFDTMMGEYNTFHEDSYWQIAGRMLDEYHRPPDQPRGDDPNPPKYLGPDSPRGPYFYVVFEPTKAGAYEWCRGRCTLEQIKQEDAYIRATGATLTGYPVQK